MRGDDHGRCRNDDHAAEDEESRHVRSGDDVVREFADGRVEAGVEDRHQEDASTRPGVQPHDQDSREEQGNELDDQEDRRRDELFDPQAFVDEEVREMPDRPGECDQRAELQRAVAVLPSVLEEAGPADLLRQLEEDEL